MGPMILAALSAYVAVDEDGAASKSELAAHYQGHIEAVDEAVVHTLAAVAVSIALAYCHAQGKEFTPASIDGTFVGNTLLMQGKVDANGRPDAKLEKALEKLWVLYADHELSNSTATVLCAASTLTDPISASMAGIVSGDMNSAPAVRVLTSRPKPQCWEHGCNGREFSTFSNLLRHQREKSGVAAKSNCPRCGAEFTRTTARNGHLAHDKCRKRNQPKHQAVQTMITAD